MRAGAHKLWPEVTSPVARRIMVYLFNLPGTYTDSDFRDRMRSLEIERSMTGLRDLWQRIQDSDIATQLAGGPGALPDIAESVSGVNRQLYRLFRPRTLEQQVSAVARNLAWYLDPASAKPVNYFRPLIPALLVAGIVAALVAIMSLLPLLVRTGYGLATSAGLMVLSLTLSTATIIQTFKRDRQPSAFDRLMLRLVVGKGPSFNTCATVLYHYLRQEYGDVG